MCGLVGVAGHINGNGEKMFKRLLELDTSRGPHSTGVLSVNPKGETAVVKQLGTPWDLYDSKSFTSMFARPTHNVLLGHNRYATKGKINKMNAHPFEFDRVVGAHNGTLYSTFYLDDHLEFEVDSENIYHHMNNNGAIETIPLLRGAFALTWYDKVDQTINLIRNKERPLFYTLSKDNKTLAWASEAWMLAVAFGTGNIEHHPIVELPVGVLFTFEVPLGAPAVALEKARTRKLEMYQTYVAPKGNTSTSNVSTLPYKKTEVATKLADAKPAANYDRLVGTACVFEVGTPKVSASKQQYLDCEAVDDANLRVRIFAPVGGPLWTQMLGSTSYFEGTVQSYASNDGGYVTINLRTIKEVKSSSEEDDSPKPKYTIFGNEPVDELRLIHLLGKGCGWCAEVSPIEDWEDIVWATKTCYTCKACTEDQERTSSVAFTHH